MRLGTTLRSGLALLVLGFALPAAAGSISFRWTHYDGSGSSSILTFGSFSSQSLSLFGSQNSFHSDSNRLTGGGLFDRLETLHGNRVVGSSLLRLAPSFSGYHFNYLKDHVYCPPRHDDAPIPEPSAALLFAVGGGVVALRVRAPRRLA